MNLPGEWAIDQVKKAAIASRRLGLKRMLLFWFFTLAYGSSLATTTKGLVEDGFGASQTMVTYSGCI